MDSHERSSNRRRLPKQFTTYRTPGVQRPVHPFDSHKSLFTHEIRRESTNHTQGIFRGLTLVARFVRVSAVGLLVWSKAAIIRDTDCVCSGARGFAADVARDSNA